MISNHAQVPLNIIMEIKKKKIIRLPKINNKRKNKRLNHLNIEINEKISAINKNANLGKTVFYYITVVKLKHTVSKWTKVLTRTRSTNKAIYIIGSSLHAKIHLYPKSQTDQFLKVFSFFRDSSLQNVSVSKNNWYLIE